MTASSTDRNRNDPITVAGVTVKPGLRRIVEIPAGRMVTGTEVSLRSAVINGKHPGPRLWLTGAVHGDELNGVEIVRRLIAAIDAKALHGSVVAVPIVNVFGFIEGSRYLPDRRDLNRAFPGSARGSLASRLAKLIVEHVLADSHVGIDFHTGTDHRTNVPQVRADLDHPETRRLAAVFGARFMLHARTRDGSMRQAATDMGKTMLLFEGGGPFRFDTDVIEAGFSGSLRVMEALGMIGAAPLAPGPTHELRESSWVRAKRAGIHRSEVSPGARVMQGDRLGEIGDALGGRPTVVRATASGWVIGLSENPLVNRGDALVHIGKEPAAD